MCGGAKEWYLYHHWIDVREQELTTADKAALLKAEQEGAAREKVLRDLGH